MQESNGLTEYPLSKIMEAMERNISKYLVNDPKKVQFATVDLKTLVGNVNDFDRISEAAMAQLSLLTLRKTIEKCLSSSETKDPEKSHEITHLALKMFGIISSIQNRELANELLISFFTHYHGSILDLCCSQILCAGKNFLG